MRERERERERGRERERECVKEAERKSYEVMLCASSASEGAYRGASLTRKRPPP